MVLVSLVIGEPYIGILPMLGWGLGFPLLVKLNIIRRSIRNVMFVCTISLCTPAHSQVNFFYPDWFTDAPTFYVAQNYSASACEEVKNDDLQAAKDAAMKSARGEISNYLSSLEGKGGEDGLRAASRGVYMSESSRVIDTDKKKEFFCALGSIPYAKLEAAMQTGLSESELKKVLGALKPAIDLAAFGILSEPEKPQDYLKNIGGYLAVGNYQKAEEMLAGLMSKSLSDEEELEAKLSLLEFYSENARSQEAWKIFETMIVKALVTDQIIDYVDWFRESELDVEDELHSLDEVRGTWLGKYLSIRVNREVYEYGTLLIRELEQVKELYETEPECVPCLVELARGPYSHLTLNRQRLAEWSDAEVKKRMSELSRYLSDYDSWLLMNELYASTYGRQPTFEVKVVVADPYAGVRDKEKYEAYMHRAYASFPEPGRSTMIQRAWSVATQEVEPVDTFKANIMLTGDTATRMKWRFKGQQRYVPVASEADVTREQILALPPGMEGVGASLEQHAEQMENFPNSLTGGTYAVPSTRIEISGDQPDAMLEIAYEDLDGVDRFIEVLFDNPQL